MKTRVSDKKNKKLYMTLLNHMLLKEKIDSIHTVLVHGLQVTMHQTTKSELIVEYAGDFYSRAKDYQEFLHQMSLLTRKSVSHSDITVTQTTIVEHIEEVFVDRGGRAVSQVDKDFFPKRFSVKTGIVVGDRAFYIVKKSPLGKVLKNTFNVYSYTSRLLVFSHTDKDICIAWLKMHYEKIKDLDYG